jgi:hypothetical protein
VKAIEVNRANFCVFAMRALSCRMAVEVQPINTQDLKSRVRELGRFL